MKKLNEICSHWDQVREYWQELDDFVLNCTATVELQKSIEINGKLEKSLVGRLGILETTFQEFQDSGKKRVHPIVSGWNFTQISELRTKKDNADYQIRNIFIPFDSISGIVMTNPSQNNKVTITKNK